MKSIRAAADDLLSSTSVCRATVAFSSSTASGSSAIRTERGRRQNTSSQKGFTNHVDRTDCHEQSLEIGRFVAIKAWIVASKELAFKSVRFEQDISGNPLSFRLQEFSQSIHSLYYALMHHGVTSGDLDVPAYAFNESVEFGHRVFALVGKSCRSFIQPASMITRN